MMNFDRKPEGGTEVPVRYGELVTLICNDLVLNSSL